MRKILITLLSFSLFFLFADMVLAQNTNPQNQRQRTITTLPRDQVVNHDYFASGDVVQISGTVNGDVYTAGGQVIVDGIINGDLLAAGGTVNVSGNIAGNARIAGGSVNISGIIGRNLSVAGGDVQVNGSAKLNGNFVAGAGNVNLTAPVAKDVEVGAGSLIVSNAVGGNLINAGGSLHLSPGANVKGNLAYYSNQTASIDKDAIVSGTVIQNPPLNFGKAPGQDLTKSLAGLATVLKIMGVISTLILGLLIIFLLPKYTNEAVLFLQKNPWLSLFAGVITFFLAPIIFIILFITVIGIPLGLILITIYFIFLYIAKIFVMLWFGNYLANRFGWDISAIWAFVIGLGVYYIVTLIPVLGGIIGFFVLLFGLGMIILTLRGIFLVQMLPKKKQVLSYPS